MKNIIIFICLFFTTAIYAQDTLSTTKIDQILQEQREVLQKQEHLLGNSDPQEKKIVSQEKKLMTRDEKIDQIILNQKKLDKLLQNQKMIYTKVENDPFKEKDYGVEINLVRLLLSNSEYKTFTGTFSIFYPKDKVEIAFPLFSSSEEDWYGGKYEVTTLDIHYRKFLGDTMNGFYLSGFIRAAYLKGALYDYSWYYTGADSVEYDSENKLGAGFGIGYRIFSKSGFYWGTSLIIGKYIVGENDRFDYGGIDDIEYIVDVELLKFGYAF